MKMTIKNFSLASLFISALLAVGLVKADTFDGYECTDDCSGHQAGYEWAEEHDIDDDSSCSTASNSFNEGCESYVNGGAGQIAADDDDDDQIWSDEDDDEDEDE